MRIKLIRNDARCMGYFDSITLFMELPYYMDLNFRNLIFGTPHRSFVMIGHMMYEDDV